MKRTNRFLSILLTLCLLLGVSPVTANASQLSPEEEKAEFLAAQEMQSGISLLNETDRYIRNQYVEAYITDNGQFTMGTVEGDPNSEDDNNALLLFGHPSPWSSETLVRISGNNYFFHNYVTSVTYNAANTECIATAMIDGVQVRQILTLTTNPYTNIQDLVSIRYTYLNTTSEAKQVGIRIMLDTMLGYNDGAPFRVNGTAVTRETEFSGNNVPQYWQSFDNLENPRVTSTGFLFFNENEKPDKVQFTYWGHMHSNYNWDYTVNPDDYVTDDSAVSAYFNPRTIPAGGNGSVGTYYGVSGFASGNTDLDDELSVRITAPARLSGATMVSGYQNNPFAVSAYLSNPGQNVIPDVRAVLSLNNAPELVVDDTQATTVYLGDLGSEERSVQWTIRAIPQSIACAANYTVSFYSGDRLLKTMDLSVVLDALAQVNMYRTVSFDLNGGHGQAPSDQQVLIGGLAQMPDKPTRPGYVFGGWYANQRCTGAPWFNLFNLYKGNPVIENITLYAKWTQQSALTYGEDTYDFENTDSDFFNWWGSLWSGNYRITGDYYDVLIEGLTNSQKAEIRRQMNSNWGGSCFGMSSVLSLVRAGELDVDFFQTDADTLHDLETPRDSDTVFNLINYYQLTQFTPITAAARGNYNSVNETSNNRAVINALDESAYPVVVGFNILDANNNRLGGHAVVAYDYTDEGSEYHVSIWDPNNKHDPNTLVISKDFTTSDFTSTYDNGNISSYMKYALTVEDGAYDHKNIQQALVDRGYSSASGAHSLFTLNRELTLNTNYPSFTIVGSDGTSAVIENGQVISGDMDISNAEYINEMGYELSLNFIILDSGDVAYTVTPAEAVSAVTGEALEAYSTTLSDHDTENGFYSELVAQGIGAVTFTADGTLTTEFENDTAQIIAVASNDTTTPWDSVSVQAVSSGMAVSVDSDTTSISSVSDTTVLVGAENDYSSIIFDEVDLTSNADLALVESDNFSGAAALGDQLQEMGHALIFYTLGGSSVPAQTDIPSGDTAYEVEDPVRSGFVFDGWYTDEACSDGCEWDFNTPIYEDMRIYAKWLVNDDYMHNITFRVEGYDDVIIVVRDGTDLDDSQIPEVPVRHGVVGQWDIEDFTSISSDMVVNAVYPLGDSIPMYRLYNPNSGEHFYTGSSLERDDLAFAGWNYEGIGWYAPTQSGAPVYRVFNPNSGDHHYTMSQEEVDNLVAVGWIYEGVAWNGTDSDGVPQYRLYNPNADCGSHHYTSSVEEREFLVSLGWIYEGIGWFGML